VRVACFCGAVFDADPPVGMCPNCDADAVVCASSESEALELRATYEEALGAIRALPEAA
jgi:hypothetical protein